MPNCKGAEIFVGSVYAEEGTITGNDGGNGGTLRYQLTGGSNANGDRNTLIYYTIPCASAGSASLSITYDLNNVSTTTNYTISSIVLCDGNGVAYGAEDAWGPSPTTVCSGVSFTQTRTGGTGCTETRSNTGTKGPSWGAWLPDTASVCSGAGFTQTRIDANGCLANETRGATGTGVAASWTAWGPDTNTVCNGVGFTQTRTDTSGCNVAQTRGATGTFVPVLGGTITNSKFSPFYWQPFTTNPPAGCDCCDAEVTLPFMASDIFQFQFKYDFTGFDVDTTFLRFDLHRSWPSLQSWAGVGTILWNNATNKIAGVQITFPVDATLEDSGCYYIRVVAVRCATEVTIAISNPLRLVKDDCDYPLVQYRNYESNFDLLYPDATVKHQLRFPIKIDRAEYKGKNESYETSLGSQVALYSRFNKIYKLESDRLGERIHDALIAALNHDLFKVYSSTYASYLTYRWNEGDYKPAWSNKTDRLKIAKINTSVIADAFVIENSPGGIGGGVAPGVVAPGTTDYLRTWVGYADDKLGTNLVLDTGQTNIDFVAKNYLGIYEKLGTPVAGDFAKRWISIQEYPIITPIVNGLTPDSNEIVAYPWYQARTADLTDAGAGRCSQWNERSGAGGFQLLQATSGNRPLIRSFGVDSFQDVYATTDDFMATAGNVTFPNNFIFVALCRAQVVTTGALIAMDNGAGAGSDGAISPTNVNGSAAVINLRRASSSTSRYDAFLQQSDALNLIIIANPYLSGGPAVCRVNGVPMPLSVASGVSGTFIWGSSGAKPLQIFRYWTGAAWSYFTGSMLEWFIADISTKIADDSWRRYMMGLETYYLRGGNASAWQPNGLNYKIGGL